MLYSREDVRDNLQMTAEVVVVGSGAGGATVARELSREGRRVVLLEVGKRYTRDDFDFRMEKAFMNMYWYGGVLSTFGSPVVLIPQGKALGGTTTINSGTCFRVPRHILKKWHFDHGLWEIGEEELDLYYSAVEEYLFVQKSDPEVAGRNNLLFLEGARNLGLSGGLISRNAKDCEGYGVCCFGCPSGAKQSADVSYIPDALDAGCDIYTDCRVDSIATKSGKATGVRGSFIPPEGGPGGPVVEVEAEVVVLSAGAIHTPMLLLAQGLCNSSGMVGRNLTVHPGTGVLAQLDEEIGNPRGIPQSTYVDEFAGDGVMLEGFASPPLGVAASLPYYGKRNAELMRRCGNLGSYGGMVSERCSTGRVVPHPRDKRRPVIFYNIRGEDKRRFKRITELTAEVWLGLGARRVFTQAGNFPELRNSRDLREFKEAKERRVYYLGVTAYHPLGTCRMGSDPELSVAKHTGESWDLENLFICDGSMVPTSLGVNPQLTIFALAMRCAGFIEDKLGSR